MKIETRIKEVMKSKGMSIKNVAKEIGVTPQSLGGNLNGKSSMKLNTLYKVSEVLGIAWTDYETKT